MLSTPCRSVADLAAFAISIRTGSAWGSVQRPSRPDSLLISFPIMSKQTSRKGQCHCGAVKFEVVLDDDLNTARRCTCSFCRMRGAVAVSGAENGITILQGKEDLTTYLFHTKVCEHYFCSHCGIYTHHQRRSEPGKFGVNVACLEGVSPFDFEDVPVNDGVNHPKDTKKLARLAGHLKFIKTTD